MNKVNFFAITGAAGTIASYLANANEILRSLAAIASIIASCFAILLARRKLSDLGRNPAPPSSEASAKEDRRGDILSIILAFSLQPLALAFAIATLTGCAIPPNSVHSPQSSKLIHRLAQFPAQILDSAAKLVTTTTTNIVEQAIITPAEAVASIWDPNSVSSVTSVVKTESDSTPRTSQLRYVTNYTLVTNIIATAKPALTKSAEVADTAAGFLPPPYGELAAGILALATAGLTAAVKRRNAMLKTVITGVEEAGQKTVKERINAEAKQNGIAPALHALVKQLTQAK